MLTTYTTRDHDRGVMPATYTGARDCFAAVGGRCVPVLSADRSGLFDVGFFGNGLCRDCRRDMVE